jgi:hypothetical protein
MGHIAERIMFCGPTGSGKTSRLRDIYHKLLEGGISSDNIQVLVLNRRQAAWWKDHINATHSGALHINTYFSFVQRELQRFWHVAQAGMTEGQPVLEPVFLNMETAQYLMELCIDEMRQQGRFLDEGFRSRPARMALQLTETMQIAAITRLDARDIAERLKKAWGDKTDPPAVYDDVRETIELYRRRCLTNRMLDYALSLELYNTVLLKNEEYQQWLRGKMRHLLVDDTEEILPAAFECIMTMLPHVQSASFAYCTDGGHSVFFGAHPELAKEKLMPLCTVEQLHGSYTSADICGVWGATLAAKVRGEDAPAVPQNIVIQHVAEDLRGTMVEQVGESILQLLSTGVLPKDIAVVAPFVDKVLEHQLQYMLGLRGCAIEHASGSKRLIELPFARALLTLLQLLHPQWQQYPTTVDMAQALAVLLDLDPIRSMILAEYSGKNGWTDIEDQTMRGRVGYAAAQDFGFLCRQLAALREPASIDAVVLRIFIRLLYPLGPSPDNLQGCRMLAEAARNFRIFAEAAQLGEQAGWHFVQMVQRGTIAADRLSVLPENPEAVVLTTAYALLMNKGAAFAYQYWLDVSRDAWYRSDAKELTNPHVLSARWQEGQLWTDLLNDQLRREKTARTVQGLSRRCRNGLVVAESACDSYGSEREGELAALIADISTGSARGLNI